MSALADALTAAQGRALAALERAYLRNLVSAENFVDQCDTIGARDVIERADLLACLDVLREYGTTEPPAANGQSARKPISKAQRDYVATLADERGFVMPATAGLSSEEASKLISELKGGTYDPAAWDIPF